MTVDELRERLASVPGNYIVAAGHYMVETVDGTPYSEFDTETNVSIDVFENDAGDGTGSLVITGVRNA